MTTPDCEAILPHFDIYNPEHVQIRDDVLAYAREHCPVPHTDSEGGFHLITRYEDVRRVLLDPATFSSKAVGPRPNPICLNPLDVDPPYQVELRKLLNPLFSRAALMRFEPVMRGIARDLVDGWVDRETIDLAIDFSIPFAATTLARIVFDGFEDRTVVEIVDVVARIGSGDLLAYGELLNHAANFLAMYEGRSENIDNRLVAALLEGTVDGGRPLTTEERLGVISVTFLGGLDTVRGVIPMIALELDADPTLEHRLRDPNWVRNDLDELIRLLSPVTTLARTVTRDCEVGDTKLKAGDRVLVFFGSASRDPERFDNPDVLAFDTPRPAHASFGLGVHRCLGMHLARLQLEIAFDELFKQITNIKVAGPVTWATGIAQIPESLPIRFDRVLVGTSR
jgi:cytochrome P450